MPTGEVAHPPDPLRPALLREGIRPAPHGVLAARLLRLLRRAAAAPATGRHRLASSPSRSTGRRPTTSRPTSSGGKGSTARACWPTPSTIRSAAITATCRRLRSITPGATSGGRRCTTRRCSPSATATAAAARRPKWSSASVQLRDFPVLPRARWGHVADFFAKAHERAAETDAARLARRDLSRTAPRDADHAIRRQAPASPGRTRADHRRDRGVARPYAGRRAAGFAGDRIGAACSRTSSTTSCPAPRSARSMRTPKRELGDVIAAGKATQEAALDALVAHLPKGTGDRLLVVNPSLAVRRIGAGGARPCRRSALPSWRATARRSPVSRPARRISKTPS